MVAILPWPCTRHGCRTQVLAATLRATKEPAPSTKLPYRDLLEQVSQWYVWSAPLETDFLMVLLTILLSDNYLLFTRAAAQADLKNCHSNAATVLFMQMGELVCPGS